MQDTLTRRIQTNNSLTENEIEQMMEIFGKRCQEKTKRMLHRVLTWVPDIDDYGIYGRVHFENGRVSYCAGQSYPDEIRTVRNCLLGR